MRLLLDTHALIWWLSADASLSEAAREAIADSDTDVAVSAASAWEISIKSALGKLRAPGDLAEQLVGHQFTPLAITVLHAVVAGSLPATTTTPSTACSWHKRSSRA